MARGELAAMQAARVSEGTMQPAVPEHGRPSSSSTVKIEIPPKKYTEILIFVTS